MERLTYDFCMNENHCWQVHGADNELCQDFCKQHEEAGCKSCPIGKAIDRLAAIEDILGEEYDIDHLRELVRAEKDGRMIILPAPRKKAIICDGYRCYSDFTAEDINNLLSAWDSGRLVVLPCKVGDTVYQIDGIRAYPLNIRKIIYDCGHIAFDESEIGKSVFVSREEAEAALKGGEG